jgi:hypothetical protein
VAAMSGGQANYGWAFRATSGTSALKRFTAREGSIPGNRPKLVIQYIDTDP